MEEHAVSRTKEECMLWIKDIAAAAGLVAFGFGVFALAGAAHAAHLIH
jgi:hypothetical protein